MIEIHRSFAERFQKEDFSMNQQSFNANWCFLNGNKDSLLTSLRGGAQEAEFVTLPHDAMIHEERSSAVPAGGQSGFYPGGLYHYTKKFDVPREWENNTVTIEFEGVYSNARVFINGDFAGSCPHGYSNFYICADGFLKYGQENEIKVTANNSAQPNSRWYSGSGIYRNVNLFVGDPVHIPVNGVKISTPTVTDQDAVVVVRTELKNLLVSGKTLTVSTVLTAPDGTIAASDNKRITVFQKETATQRMVVAAPQLWDCDTPNLYTAVVTVKDGDQVLDTVTETFGIRTLTLDAKNGIRLNGKTVKLRGACIHHDNGIIGAATLPRAEERRCEQLKNAGFNCLRSSHHPMGKAMLAACDKLGMLVMDELSDIWTRSKNINDYSTFFMENWENDVQHIVDKDFNHPCVILYCTGNEIQEAGTARGAQLNRKISDKFKALDPSRYTTSALNGMIAVSDVMGEILMDVLSKAGISLPSASSGGEGGDGSNILNSMMSLLMSGPTGDAFSAHPLMTQRIEEFADATDIAGYNYLTGRHVLDHTLNPNRIVLGTETFPADIVRLWDIVKNNDHVIGDMTWAGYDYLGEAGCGVFYYDGSMNFGSHWPDRTAYIGDIDLAGYRRPISYLREIVYGLKKDPYIAVERVNRYGQAHSQTPWMFKDNIASWTWPGYEGKPAKVDVYAADEEVELFLNGQSLGRKPAGEANGYTASYEITYAPGELKAVGYTGGQAVSQHVLVTADSSVALCAEADRTVLKADGADLSYITLCLKDSCGNVNLNARKEVTISIEGAGTIQGFGNADPQSTFSFDERTWPTYDGYLLAAIRTTAEAGEIRVTFTTDDCESVVVTLRSEQ